MRRNWQPTLHFAESLFGQAKHDTSTTTESGNEITGSYSNTSSDTLTTTASDSGTDARGAFTSNTTVTNTLTTTDSANLITGSDLLTTTDTVITTGTKTGGTRLRLIGLTSRARTAARDLSGVR